MLDGQNQIEDMMKEQGNFVYNEEFLQLVDKKLDKLRDVMLCNSIATAGADKSSIREDGKVVVSPRHLMKDEELGFYLNAMKKAV